MQFTVDTRTATQFELTSLNEFIAKLQTQAPTSVEAFYAADLTPQNTAGNDSPDDSSQLGNDLASTVIPQVPANVPDSASQSHVPAAPSVTPATGASVVPADPSEVKLDSAGFPWDARIHTANKAVIGDGTWRKKPGVDMALYASVQAEWTASQAGGVPAIPNVAATGATSDAQPQSSDVPAVPTLSAQDVLARCTEIQMADMSKGTALFQAIVGAGVPGGPMGLSTIVDQSILAACLAAVNAVGAA